MKEKKWNPRTRKLLWTFGAAATENGTRNVNSKSIEANTMRDIAKLMTIYCGDGVGVEAQIAYVVRGQNRSEFDPEDKGRLATFDGNMFAAMIAGFITGSEFTERMTN